VSPLRGEKPQNRPLSKLNNRRFALRAMLPVNDDSDKSMNSDIERRIAVSVHTCAEPAIDKAGDMRSVDNAPVYLDELRSLNHCCSVPPLPLLALLLLFLLNQARLSRGRVFIALSISLYARLLVSHSTAIDT